MENPTAGQSSQVHFTITNIATHLERTFQYWTIKDPSIQIQIQRSATFIASLLITVFWPISDLLINALLLSLIWIVLSLTEKPANRLFLLTNLMLNISLFYYITQLWVNKIN